MHGKQFMNEFSNIAKFLIIIGLVLAAIGVFLNFGWSLKWMGRLPGDIYIKKDNFTFYFPLATSILISIILSVILYLLRK